MPHSGAIGAQHRSIRGSTGRRSGDVIVEPADSMAFPDAVAHVVKATEG